MKKIFKHIGHFFFQKKRKQGKTIIKICKLPFPIKESKIKQLRQQLEVWEKLHIATSGFWDDLWYIKKYAHDFDRQKALDYWYKTGWKKGESPSKYINVEFCKNACGMNPISAYLSKDTIFFPDNKNNYKSKNDKERVKAYWDGKKQRKAKSVIYTCITNDYDHISEIQAYGYINPEWDYVCFTDNQEDIKRKKVGIWEIRPLQYSKSDVSRNNRWHKMHPHILFPDYEESIYLDANINILTDFLFKEIRHLNTSIVLPRHFKNVYLFRIWRCVAS